jgi:protein ImuB
MAIVGSFLPGQPRVGIGNTRFGAAVAARIGTGVIPAGGQREEAAFLAPLPLSLTQAEPGVHERLRVLGLETMGQLAALDHSAVVARFGPAGAEMHDLVRGMDRRPLRPRHPLEQLVADVELEPPAAELEPLRFVLHHLSSTLCEQLAARGAGAARATLMLSLERSERDPGPRAMTYRQALPEPSAAAELLERLLMARLEAEPPSAPVERLALQLDGAAPEAGQQLTLFDRQGAQAARLEWQLASLAIRFGEDRILRAITADVEAPLAERRFVWHEAAGPDA